jgi:hypothetical protein
MQRRGCRLRRTDTIFAFWGKLDYGAACDLLREGGLVSAGIVWTGFQVPLQ